MNQFEQLCAAIVAFSEEHWRLYRLLLPFKDAEHPERIRSLAAMSEKVLDGAKGLVGFLLVGCLERKDLAEALEVIRKTQAEMTKDAEGSIDSLRLLTSARKTFPEPAAPRSASPDYW